MLYLLLSALLTATAACRNTTCSNNGSCLNLLNGDVYCKCLPGTTGPYCDIGNCLIINLSIMLY